MQGFAQEGEGDEDEGGNGAGRGVPETALAEEPVLDAVPLAPVSSPIVLGGLAICARKRPDRRGNRRMQVIEHQRGWYEAKKTA